MRSGGLHAGPRRARSARCRSTTSNCCWQVWGDRTARLGARDDDRLRAAVREPRRRGRRHAAPSARPDLRLPGGPARAGAHAGRCASTITPSHGRGLLAGPDRSGASQAAIASFTWRRTRSLSCPCAPAIRTRSGSRRSSRSRPFRHLSAAAARGPGARAEDGAAQIRRTLAAAVPVSDGVVPGAHRRRLIPKRTCTPSSIRRIARATKLKYLAGTEIAGGFFAMDALPEDKARELQDVRVVLE